MSELFRAEALAARGSQSFGTIVLRRPIPMRIAAVIATLLTLALVAFLWNGEYTRKVHVKGQLIPTAGSIKAVSPQFGRVIIRSVHDGDHVIAGQVLYELSSERDSADGGIDSRIDASLQSRRELLMQEQSLQYQQLQQHRRMLETRLHLIEAEISRGDQEIELHKSRVDSAFKTLERYKALREQGFVSEFQLTQFENDYNDQLARAQTLARAKLASTRDLLQIREDADQVNNQIRLNATQSERSLASLEQESAEHQGRSRIQILASEAGVITALTADVGQVVNAGATLGTIIPSGSELEAHLLAPSQAIGFVAKGQPVLLRLAAFPYQKFGQIQGTVTRVEQSPIAESNGGNQEDHQGTQEPEYRIVVQLKQQSVTAYGKQQPFRAGMTLEADIRQDRRRLIDWFLDPIISITKGRAEW